MTWVNYHAHTVYSFLDGTGKPKAYAKRAAELGMQYLCTTDHGNVCVWPDFVEACQEEGLNYILGMEAYQARKTRFDRDPEERAGPAEFEWQQRGPYHLTVLARTQAGLRNLIKLSSLSYTEGFFVKPRIDMELLGQYGEGLIVGSGCLNGAVQQAVSREDLNYALEIAGQMQDIVGRDYYFIEVMDHDLMEQRKVKDAVLDIARKINAPIVPTGDCHYVNPEDAHAHDAALCVGTKTVVSEEKRFKFNGPHYYLHSYEEMLQKFEPEWLKNSLIIAETVEQVKLGSDAFYFPPYPDLPAGMTADSFLQKLVIDGIKERYPVITEEVKDRVKYELQTIQTMGFSPYFLVVWDIVSWAKKEGIRVGPSRGSAAGCIVSYALGITGLDPLEYGLLFERFLNPSRVTMPDIDIDFDDRYRERVLNFIRQRYGDNQVVGICTFSTVKAKSAIRDAARVLGYEHRTGGRLADLVPPPVFGVTKTLEETLANPDARKVYESEEESRHILDVAKGLEGLVRQPGIHAAAVVIAPSDVSDFLPVMQRPDKQGERGIVTTQWSMAHVEEAGLIKMDCLGLRNLSVIDLCLASIKKRHGIDLDIDHIPKDDRIVYAELQKANSIGVFQLEGTAMRDLMRSLAPTNFDDLAALVALYRPGPMAANMHNDYADRKNGRKPVVYLHPDAEEVLGDTYGLMIYQEELMQIAQKFAGYTLAEADNLRKACAKKKPEVMAKEEKKFIEGCIAQGYGAKLGQQWWAIIKPFADYAFPKAHAYGYGLIAYQTAYLKFNYSVEYMSALLTSAAAKDLPLYLNECRKLGLTVSPPSINRSVADFDVLSDTEILFGLSAIRGLGGTLVDYLLQGRDEPYYSLNHFLRKVHPEILNKGVLEHLLESGALDELVPDPPPRMLSRDEKMTILEAEHKTLGTYITEHPLLGLSQVFEGTVDTTIVDLETKATGQIVALGGVIVNRADKVTKRGDRMHILQVEDLTGSTEVVVFPALSRKLGDSVPNLGDIVIMNCRINREGDDESEIRLILLSLTVPELPQYGSGEPIVITCSAAPDYAIVKRMEQLIRDHPGDRPVYLRYPEGPHIFSARFNLAASVEAEENLQILGKVADGSQGLLQKSG